MHKKTISQNANDMQHTKGIMRIVFATVFILLSASLVHRLADRNLSAT